MKKILTLVIIGVLLSIAAFAGIIMFQDGKTMVYHQGSEVNTNGKAVSRVLYDGVLVTAPKGQKLTIKGQEDETGKKVVVSGSNFQNVEVAGKNVSSRGNTVIVVSPETLEVTSVKGNTTIQENGVVVNSIGKVDAKQEDKVEKEAKKSVSKQNNYAVSSSKTFANKSVDFPEISDYVNEVAVQQGIQDIERSDMSQSTTTGA